MSGTRYLGEVDQGIEEEISGYTVTTTNWGPTPTGVTVVVTDESKNNEDVTATVTSGSSSVTGDVITLPTIKSLVMGHVYRVEIKFTAGGNVLEAYFRIRAEL